MPKINIEIDQETLAYFEHARDEWNARHQEARSLEDCIAMVLNNFPHMMAEWQELSRYAIEQMQENNRLTQENAYQCREAFIYRVSHEQALEDKAADIRKAVSNNARKAGLAKKSLYEKAGVIDAVNALLAANKDLLNQRGGKAILNRMILDLIVTGIISSPCTPTPKTVDSWIDKFKNTQLYYADLPQ